MSPRTDVGSLTVCPGDLTTTPAKGAKTTPVTNTITGDVAATLVTKITTEDVDIKPIVTVPEITTVVTSDGVTTSDIPTANQPGAQAATQEDDGVGKF